MKLRCRYFLISVVSWVGGLFVRVIAVRMGGSLAHPEEKFNVKHARWSCVFKIKFLFQVSYGQWLAKQPLQVAWCLRHFSQKIWSVEVLETFPVGTKPRSSHHQSLGGERQGKRKSVRQFTLKGWERGIVNQMNIGTVSKAILGKHLRDGVECIRVFPGA